MTSSTGGLMRPCLTPVVCKNMTLRRIGWHIICNTMSRDKFVDTRELLITEMERDAHELEVEDAEVRLTF